MSKSRVLFIVQEEVKDGSVAVSLTRPLSYPLFHLSRAMGESVVKILPLMVEGLLMGLLLVGPLPGYLGALPGGLLLILGGILITNLWMLLIGLVAFWTEEVAPFYCQSHSPLLAGMGVGALPPRPPPHPNGLLAFCASPRLSL